MRVSRFPCLALGALFALAIGLAGCGGGRRGGGDGIFDLDEGLPHPSDYPIHGIDVSKYQGDIDWNAVKASGVKFVWIKATEGGDHADEKFTANWAGAKSVGIPHGAYHFVYWCRPPSEEVSWFEQNVPIEDDSLPPVLDVEATPTSQTCHRHLERESAILEPELLIPVGTLAIERVLGTKEPLVDVIGTRTRWRWYGRDVDVIALPHPSGASPWHRIEPGKGLLKKALAMLAKHPAMRRALESAG